MTAFIVSRAQSALVPLLLVDEHLAETERERERYIHIFSLVELLKIVNRSIESSRAL